jgi:hypothetical protein
MPGMMRALRLSLAILGLGCAGFGCAGHLAGDLKIDGVPFHPIHCRSGKALGFEGVELGDENAARLRLAQSSDGTSMTVYFPPGSAVGDSLGACSTLNVVPGTGAVDGIKNLDGDATLSCLTPPHTARGTIRFKNCH